MQGGTVRCSVCGDEVPVYYIGASGACYECHLASCLPRWYPVAEAYRYVAQYGHSNATRTPDTGVDWLDEGHMRICDALLWCTEKPRRG